MRLTPGRMDGSPGGLVPVVALVPRFTTG